MANSITVACGHREWAIGMDGSAARQRQCALPCRECRGQMKLNATRFQDDDGQTYWQGYLVVDGLARPITSFRELDDIREFADQTGFDGILIGSPSAPWAN